MARTSFSPELLARIAERFKSLGEPTRLHILNVLRAGERTVGEIVERTGLTQANVSRHLRILREHGFVERRREKAFVYYSLRGEDVFVLCELMCSQLEDDFAHAVMTFATA